MTLEPGAQDKTCPKRCSTVLQNKTRQKDSGWQDDHLWMISFHFTLLAAFIRAQPQIGFYSGPEHWIFSSFHYHTIWQLDHFLSCPVLCFYVYTSQAFWGQRPYPLLHVSPNTKSILYFLGHIKPTFPFIMSSIFIIPHTSWGNSHFAQRRLRSWKAHWLAHSFIAAEGQS